MKDFSLDQRNAPAYTGVILRIAPFAQRRLRREIDCAQKVPYFDPCNALLAPHISNVGCSNSRDTRIQSMPPKPLRVFSVRAAGIFPPFPVGVTLNG